MTRLRMLGVAALLGLLGVVNPPPTSAQIIISPPATVIPANLTPDTVCFDEANQDVCLSRGGPGVLTIAAVGLANNLDLDIDLETSATQIGFSSPAGATGITLTGLDLTFGAGRQIFLDDGTVANPALTFVGDPDSGIMNEGTPNEWLLVAGGSGKVLIRAGGMVLGSARSLDWDTGATPTGVGDLRLFRDDPNTHAWRNATDAQEGRIYNTFTSAAENEFASLGWINNSNVFGIETEATGTGTVRDMAFLGGNVAVGTTPLTLFHIAGAVPTVYIEATGAADATLILEDTDEAGCTEITALNGVLTAATVACPA